MTTNSHTALKPSTLTRAQQIQDDAAKYYFDWPDIEPVFAKLEEEILEFKQALQTGDQSHIQEEIGDILFVCANLARHAKIDAESALQQTNDKFLRRFKFVVDSMNQANISFSPEQLSTMENFWQQAKKITG